MTPETLTGCPSTTVGLIFAARAASTAAACSSGWPETASAATTFPSSSTVTRTLTLPSACAAFAMGGYDGCGPSSICSSSPTPLPAPAPEPPPALAPPPAPLPTPTPSPRPEAAAPRTLFLAFGSDELDALGSLGALGASGGAGGCGGRARSPHCVPSANGTQTE